MDITDAGEKFSRNPTVDDLVELCRNLNEAGARYVIIGGFAILHHGFLRSTADIDLLVDSDKKNISRIKEALLYLPDQAVREVQLDDVLKYTVVKVADEIVIDILGIACGIQFNDVQENIEYDNLNGVQIPYLKAEALLLTKQSLRPQDIQDKLFLEQLIRERDKR